ncbi:hypothetical protein [Actinoplanes sp. G11-F43]|uniref:hypothetical protein n=1 Tax=Actinoplanes sp. G11-F43 TaxID=3424130 RepID=UPI003D33FE4D
MPGILGLTATLTLSAVLALPSAGHATPDADPIRSLRELISAPAAGEKPGPDSSKLTEALLSGADDLPAGFTPQLDAIDDLFARIPAEIATCGRTSGVQNGTVYREFVRGPKDEELLVETLSAPGPKKARAAVAAVRTALPKCASFVRPPGELPMELKFSVSPYDTAPALGDSSAAVAFVMDVPEMSLTVHGRLLTAAVRGATVTLVLMTEDEPKAADLEAAARGAVAKAASVLSR